MRERNEEIKRLKKQVEKLEETQAQGELGTPPAEPDACAGPSLVLAGTTMTPDSDTVHSAASVISASDWMGDYLGVLPHTPGSDHDPFVGFSHGQVDAWGSDFPGMPVVPDHLLHPVPEHSLDLAGTTAETVVSPSASCCPQHHGESSSSSCSSNGSSETCVYPPMPLGPDVMRHTRGHTMATGDSTPTDSPTLKPFTFSSNTQRLRPPTSRLNAYGNKDFYDAEHHPGRTSPFLNQARLQMGTSTCNGYHETSHRNQTSAPWCCSKPGGGYTAIAPDFSVRGGSHGGQEHQRQRTLVQPIDMDSLYAQGSFHHQGLVVEPNDCGDGVTIRLQPNATNGRASLVAFMIQHDPNPLGDNQGCRMDLDGH